MTWPLFYAIVRVHSEFRECVVDHYVVLLFDVAGATTAKYVMLAESGNELIVSLSWRGRKKRWYKTA